MSKPSFTTEVLLILGGCDMVLGIQCLRTLGQILWDFNKLLMRFEVGDISLILEAVSPGKLKIEEGEPNCKMRNYAGQVCEFQVGEVVIKVSCAIN